MSGSLSLNTTLTTKTSIYTLSTMNIELSAKNEYEDIDRKPSIAAVADLSPMEKEIKLHCDRILHVLDRTAKKLQISVCLPRLLRWDACILRRYLNPQEVEFVQKVCRKYLGEITKQEMNIKKCSLIEKLSTAIKRISLNETRKTISTKLSFPDRDIDRLTDPIMAQVMDILWNNRSLKQNVLQEFELIAENDVTIIVNYLRNLKEIMEIKLATTGKQEKIRERKLRKLWLKKNEIKKNIEEYRVLIEEQRENLGNTLQNKNALITEYINKIEELKLTVKDQLRRKVLDSEKSMAELSLDSELRQEELSAQSKLVTQQYETLLARNMVGEKQIRSRRIKIETQLCNWLNKYDADIGERNEEFEKLKDGYEKEKAEMEIVQELINEQEEEYTILFQQKEEEDQEEWEERAYQFLMNRSARKIQRCWRAYYQRKLERKKARKAKAKDKKGKSKEPKSVGGGGAKPKAGAKGKKDKDKKGKKREKKEPEKGPRPADPMAALGKKFGGGVFDELKGDDFTENTTPVDLMAH